METQPLVLYLFLPLFLQRFQPCCGVCNFLDGVTAVSSRQLLLNFSLIEHVSSTNPRRPTFIYLLFFFPIFLFCIFFIIIIIFTFLLLYCCEEMTYLQCRQKASSLWRLDVSTSFECHGNAGGNRRGSCLQLGEALQVIKISNLAVGNWLKNIYQN